MAGSVCGCVAYPQVAALWAWGAKSRSGTLLVALGFLLMPVMVMRVQEVWAGRFV